MMFLAAAADPVVLAGVFKTLAFTILIVALLAGLGVGLLGLGLGKILTAPFKLFRRRGKGGGE